MSQIKQFEDIIAWQKSKELSILVYKLMKNCKDFSFREQIQRAVISIMNNIAEGFERGTNQEFKRFLFISKGSCGEVRSLAYIALEIGYFNQDDFIKVNSLSLQISKMLSSFIKRL